MELVHLLHDPRERRTATAVVPNILEDATKPLCQRITAEALLRVRAGKLRPELALNELQHLIGMIRVLGPRRPRVLTSQPAFIGRIIKCSLFLASGFRLVECLQEKQPRQLLNVVACVNALRVKLVAGVFDDLLYFLPAM